MKALSDIEDALLAMQTSDWLRAIREGRGVSQEWLSNMAGMSVTTYGRVERCLNAGRSVNPRLSTFVRLLIALDVSADELAHFLASIKSVTAAEAA